MHPSAAAGACAHSGRQVSTPAAAPAASRHCSPRTKPAQQGIGLTRHVFLDAANLAFFRLAFSLKPTRFCFGIFLRGFRLDDHKYPRTRAFHRGVEDRGVMPSVSTHRCAVQQGV